MVVELSLQNSGNDPQQQVEDPGEFNQRTRLREIAGARQLARQALRDPDPSMSHEEQQLLAFRSVKAFTAEIEWIVRNNGGDEFFTEELGPVTIDPPDESEFRQRPDVERVWGTPTLEPKSFSIEGLYSSEETGLGFIDMPSQFTHTWTAHVDRRNRGPEHVEITRTRAMPRQVTMKANRLCRKFINDAGLDARIEDQVDEDPNPV